MARRFRTRSEELRAQLDDAGERPGSTTTQLATAVAQRDLLQQHNRELSDSASTDNDVLRALAPVAEKLTQAQRQVGLLERDRVEQYGQLARQLEEAREADARLLSTTQSSAGALRSNSARGQSGEVQLRRVVHAAGMLSCVDFLEQVTYPAGDDGDRSRPDMVVQLPGGKQLVIDSKVPLSAFLAAQELMCSSDAGGSREAAVTAETRRIGMLKQHSKAVRAHIDSLAKKKYWEGAANSPELAICFIPVESVWRKLCGPVRSCSATPSAVMWPSHHRCRCSASSKGQPSAGIRPSSRTTSANSSTSPGSCTRAGIIEATPRSLTAHALLDEETA